MTRKLTRRELAAALSATAIQSGMAQTGQRDEMQIARERLKANTGALAELQVPMSTEPAFQFKA